MPLSCLLVGVGDFEEGFFAEGLADNLHAYWQSIGEAGRNRNSWHAGNVYRQEVAVAAVDLLGMKALLEKDDKATSAMTALVGLRRNSATRDYYHAKDFKSSAGTLYQLEEHLGDSVYFFADTNLDIGTQVNRLVMKCAALIATGLLHYPRGFLVRAGIAVGDLRKKLVQPPQGAPHEIRIGTGMARAHMLQKCQEWLGGAVEVKIAPAPKEINRIKYEVPIKDNTNFQQCELEAVNWVYILANEYSNDKGKVIDAVKKSMSQPSNLANCENALKKLENTLNFVEYVFSKKDIYLQ